MSSDLVRFSIAMPVDLLVQFDALVAIDVHGFESAVLEAVYPADGGPHALQEALSSVVQDTFNMVSVDGDTSTNDTVLLMANGLAGNDEITAEDEDYEAFREALKTVACTLAKKIAADGEGASKLFEAVVEGASSTEQAKILAKAIIISNLSNAAMFGADANWGRILCAIGYAGVPLDVSTIDVSFRSDKGSISVCENGAGVGFSEEKAKEILLEKEIDILIDLKAGDVSATAWGCDLTYDYVKINGDYRT